MNNFRQHGYPVSPRIIDEDGWNIYISYIGFFSSSGDFRWEQTSPMYAVHVIQRGSGIFERNGRRYEAKEGDAFTFFPGDHVIYYDFPESPWKYIWLRLNGHDIERCLRTVGISHSKPLCAIAEAEALENYLEGIGEQYRQVKYSGLFPMTAACTCLDMISGGGMGNNTGQIGGKGIVGSFISIVESQLEPSPSVGRIAQQMRIDRTTLFRAFVKEKGVSPKKFLERRRMEKAKGLLSSTKLSIKEIAEASGFSHPAQFCRSFREEFGETPARWKSGRR